MPSNTPSVRVVVRLPWDRSENAEPDPPRIEWTPEKADILWRVIEKSRSSDSGGADWKGLAAHLEVPLPYLLYRINARFQEDIRGLKDIQGALSPSATAADPKFEAITQVERPSLTIRTGISSSGVSASNLTPRNVRVRLNSLVSNARRPQKTVSSSTITVQGPKQQPVSLHPQSPLSEDSDSFSEDEEAALKEEEAERKAEEQETLNKKLEQLSRLITSDTLGLVRTHKSKRSIDQGHGGNSPSSSNANSATNSSRGDSLSSRSDNQSLSSMSSPQGSISEIPSPATDSQPQSPMHFGRRTSATNSVSPAAVSLRGAMSHSHNRRYNQLAGDHGSGHSETSSFSDLSDSSLSTSALESALMSNTTNMRSTLGTSRLFTHPTSRSRASTNTLRPH